MGAGIATLARSARQAWGALSSRARRRPKGSRRARVPTVLQMEALECGAAALAMILAYHKRLIPLEELRLACGVSRDGSKASNMLKAARRYGLVAKGYRKEPEQLKSMKTPSIIHWNFNHFVVFEGIRRGRFYLNDPGQGPVRVSEEEFDQAFTGVVLTFEPDEGFEPGGEKRTLRRALLPRLAGSGSGLTYVVLAGLALLVPGIVSPSFSQIFVDDILVRGMQSWILPLLQVMGITALVTMAITWLRQHHLLRLETKLAVGTSSRFFWHVLRLPIRFFSQRYAGEIGSRVAINDSVAGLLSGELATTVLNFVVIVFYAALMLQYDVSLAFVSIAIAGLNLAALKLVSRKRVDLNQRLLQERGSLVGVAMGGLQTIETLKATGSESDFFARWSGYLARVTNSGQRLAVATMVLLAVPPFLLAINMAVILGLGGLKVMDGHMSMGMLMAFQALTLTFIAPVNRLVSLGGTLQEVEGDLNRLDDVLRAEAEPVVLARTAPPSRGKNGAVSPSAAEAPRKNEGPEPKLSGHLELRNISFGYNLLDPPLISDFNLTLKPGSRVALVGGSGCGKSTVSKLVAGLYEPWEGEILFDGKTRREIPRSVMTNSLALVDQDIFLFENTISDNLTLWDQTISEADVLRATRDAAIHDEVSARPQGYSSPVQEGGVNFSGGQRQRLEIARALAGNPSILVLDEATSALDPTTEKTIDDNLRRRGLTCLLVAHRLSTIRDCDEIIVMERGKIVQRGTHEELMAVEGPYNHLIAAE